MENNENRDYKFKVGDWVRLRSDLSQYRYYSIQRKQCGIISNMYETSAWKHPNMYEVKYGVSDIYDNNYELIDIIEETHLELVESCEIKETKKPITKPLLEFKLDSTPFNRFKKQLQDMVHKYDIANRLDKPIKIVIPQKPQVDFVNINMNLFPSNTKFKILSDFFIYDGWHESTNIKGVTADYVDSKANNKITLDYMGKQFDFDLEVYNYELINEPSKAKEYKDEFYDRQEYEDFDGIILQDKDKKYWL